MRTPRFTKFVSGSFPSSQNTKTMVVEEVGVPKSEDIDFKHLYNYAQNLQKKASGLVDASEDIKSLVEKVLAELDAIRYPNKNSAKQIPGETASERISYLMGLIEDEIAYVTSEIAAAKRVASTDIPSVLKRGNLNEERMKSFKETLNEGTGDYDRWLTSMKQEHGKGTAHDFSLRGSSVQMSMIRSDIRDYARTSPRGRKLHVGEYVNGELNVSIYTKDDNEDAAERELNSTIRDAQTQAKKAKLKAKRDRGRNQDSEENSIHSAPGNYTPGKA